MTEDDLPAVIPIEKSVHLAPWTTTNFLSELEKPYSQSWVLTDDETDELIFGYAVVWQIAGEAVELLNLVVSPSHQRRGVGRKIMQEVIKLAVRSGADRVVLDVRRSNEAALHLYQNLGFTIAQVRKAFYSNGEDALHLELPLVGDAIDF